MKKLRFFKKVPAIKKLPFIATSVAVLLGATFTFAQGNEDHMDNGKHKGHFKHHGNRGWHGDRDLHRGEDQGLHRGEIAHPVRTRSPRARVRVVTPRTVPIPRKGTYSPK